MAGGKSVKTKGDAGEREIVRMFGGERTHWQPGENHGDVINVPYLGRTEVKRRAAGFKQIYDWLNDNDALFMRADRRQWLVCMRAKDLKLLLDELDELKHALKTLPVGQNEQSNIVHG